LYGNNLALNFQFGCLRGVRQNKTEEAERPKKNKLHIAP
jgi:hypothetical protein